MEVSEKAWKRKNGGKIYKIVAGQSIYSENKGIVGWQDKSLCTVNNSCSEGFTISFTIPIFSTLIKVTTEKLKLKGMTTKVKLIILHMSLQENGNN